MKRNNLQPPSKMRPGVFAAQTFLLLAFVFTALAIPAMAQGNQLSLADILIALRSKKASLPDRNKILTEAITARGTTFTLTPEIEKELSVTGADKSLLDTIRQRAQLRKTSAPIQPPVDTRAKTEPAKTEPEPAPALPDFSFYEKRADESLANGNFDAAIGDYTRAIEMNPSAATALFGRGLAYFNKNSYILAIADYSKVIELNPQNAIAFARRGEAHEKKGSVDLAADDYKKALVLDPANEIAKTAMSRFQAEQAKAAPPKTEPAPIAAASKPVPAPPEFVDLGTLSENNAVRMVKPQYAQIARNAGIGGQIVVEVELDTEGNVTKARAVSGNNYLRQGCEEAARRSKFNPATANSQPIKAKGKIVYNFVPTR